MALALLASLAVVMPLGPPKAASAGQPATGPGAIKARKKAFPEGLRGPNRLQAAKALYP